jgi:hypothetical protein
MPYRPFAVNRTLASWPRLGMCRGVWKVVADVCVDTCGTRSMNSWSTTARFHNAPPRYVPGTYRIELVEVTRPSYAEGKRFDVGVSPKSIGAYNVGSEATRTAVVAAIRVEDRRPGSQSVRRRQSAGSPPPAAKPDVALSPRDYRTSFDVAPRMTIAPCASGSAQGCGRKPYDSEPCMPTAYT